MATPTPIKRPGFIRPGPLMPVEIWIPIRGSIAQPTVDISAAIPGGSMAPIRGVPR